MENTAPTATHADRYVAAYKNQQRRALAQALLATLDNGDDLADILSDYEIELAQELGYDDPDSAYAAEANPLRVVVFGDLDPNTYGPAKRDANHILAELQEIPEVGEYLSRLLREVATNWAFKRHTTDNLPGDLNRQIDALEAMVPGAVEWVYDIASDYAGEIEGFANDRFGRK